VPVNITTPSTASTLGANPAQAAAATQSQPVEAASASAFTQVYEPGSVNKLITISAALQEGLIKPSDLFTIPDSYRVADATFHDAERHGTKQWTVTDIVANSSNIGTIQIAQKLGKSNLLHYVHAFGEGSTTAVDFSGESAGLLPSYWSGTSIADVPIGQGISVTAIQMLAAYNTIANGGVYVAPRLVDGTVDALGKEHKLAAPAPRRVVSTQVANEMTTMLDEVVRVGTGKAANLSPYTVAGKTGTALVPSPKGGYEAGHYVASFAGFVPSEKPSITAMVVIDNTPDYGAAASAPTFATIARDALQELKVPPQPPNPPALFVPLATQESATGAGEVAGTPLPGLSTPPRVTTTTTAPGTTSTTVAHSSPPASSASSSTTVAPTTATSAAQSRASPGGG
jgi:cell division protein FtsI (penicillin-binding protein 3)